MKVYITNKEDKYFCGFDYSNTFPRAIWDKSEDKVLMSIPEATVLIKPSALGSDCNICLYN